jgi:SAM-dependent methyltransferase
MIIGLAARDAALPDWFPGEAAVAGFLAARQPLYRYRKPRYQLRLLEDLARLMPAGEHRVLDVGAGTGLLAEAIGTLFPGKRVTAADTAERTLPGLRVPFVAFDGRRLPFEAGAFDCALLCNVLHHVRREDRQPLLREVLRVTGGGPLLIKDHLARGALDDLRLRWLDLAGNLPFGGMLAAEYLDSRQWGELLSALGCSGSLLGASAYRSGLSARCFPNRLEICFSVTQASSSRA